jgi:hypothetical protein
VVETSFHPFRVAKDAWKRIDRGRAPSRSRVAVKHLRSLSGHEIKRFSNWIRPLPCSCIRPTTRRACHRWLLSIALMQRFSLAWRLVRLLIGHAPPRCSGRVRWRRSMPTRVMGLDSSTLKMVAKGRERLDGLSTRVVERGVICKNCIDNKLYYTCVRAYYWP